MDKIWKLWIRMEWLLKVKWLKTLCQRKKKEIIRDCCAENNKIKKHIFLGEERGRRAVVK